MAQLIVARTIGDVTKNGEKYDFVAPDMLKMMNIHIGRGDEVLIPVSTRENQIAFWESGGRNQNFVSSIGIIIASNNDELLDAILFNKLNKTPNGKQALVSLKPGYRLYAGKISVRLNALAPNIKIIRLIFSGIDEKISNDKVVYGRFVADELFTDYKSVKGCFPAERLVDKLFSKDVIKPFFANGWSISNIARMRNKDQLKEAYIKIMNLETPDEHIPLADQFLDAVENHIIKMDNKKLSAVFQCINFETGMMTIKPLSGMLLSDIVGTIDNTVVDKSFTISLEDMTSCYNTNILFNSMDIMLLEKAFEHDDRYAIATGPRIWSCIRGYRG